MLIKKIFSLILVAFLGISVSGCGAVLLGGAAAGGTYVYVTGQAKKKYNSDLDTAYKATLKACEDLNLKIESAKKRLSDAEIKAVDVDTTVLIDLSSTSSKITEISVRYGMLGDEQASAKILGAISGKL